MGDQYLTKKIQMLDIFLYFGVKMKNHTMLHLFSESDLNLKFLHEHLELKIESFTEFKTCFM